MEFAAWEVLLYTVLIVGSLAIFGRDVYAKLKVVAEGKDDRPRTDDVPGRLWTTFKEVVVGTRIISGRPIPGLMHTAVFAAFVFFALESLDHLLKPYGLPFLKVVLGEQVGLYKGLISFLAVLCILGMTGLAFRRFVMVKISPNPKSYESGFVALLIVLLMVTYLYTQTENQSVGLAKANWWVHALILLGFPHLIVRSKHFHLLMAPFDIFLRTRRLSELLPLNLDMEALESSDEEEISLGLEKMADLPWKQRLDFVTCVECRRCTDNCPANISGQELDPRGFILSGRSSLFSTESDDPVIGNVISETALGQCTTCGACESFCPVGIEHLQVLVGSKRAQAMALGTGLVASEYLETVERTGNAFGASKDARTKLIEELEIPYFEPGVTEHLLWLGCVWAYNPDSHKSLAAMVQVLKASDVSFGVLRHESCSGHHSRRQGEELQFQTLASQNMDDLKKSDVQKIITSCPHCLHTIGREYPDLDDEFGPEIVHHSQFLQQLVDSRVVKLDPAKSDGAKTTFHDPCYLGRYEGEFDAPRQLIAQAGLEVTEMERSGRRSMCCGGGAAGFQRHVQDVDKRVDTVRKEQVRETGAKLLITGCPECKMMLDAAVEETKDIAELVAETMADEQNGKRLPVVD